MDDSELVRRAAGGEREAWAAIWDLHGPGLHRYARRLVDNEHDAGDVVADTFVSAAEHLSELREADRLRPWLYAICRRHAQRRWEGRDRVRPVDDQVLAAVVDGRGGEMSPTSGVDATEAAELLWAAANGIGQADRDLLALVLSSDLESGAVAAITGDTPAAVYVKVSRLKDALGRAAGALLVARHHRQDCEELQTVLVDWDGHYAPLWRKRIARHVDGCDVCGDRRTAAAGALFSLAGAAPLLVLPDVLRDRAVDGAVAAVPVSSSTDWSPGSAASSRSHDASPSSGGRGSTARRARAGAHAPLVFDADGWPVPQPWELPRPRRRRALLAAAAAVAVLATAGGLALADDEAPTQVAAVVATSSPTAAPSATTSPEGPAVTSPAQQPATTSAPPRPTPPRTTAPAPAPSSARPSTAPTPPPSPAAPPPALTLTVADTTLDTACGTDTTTQVVARATGGTGTLAVTLTWDGTAPGQQAYAGPGPHSATVGPYSSVADSDGTDSVVVRATATDASGRTVSVEQPVSVTVAPC